MKYYMIFFILFITIINSNAKSPIIDNWVNATVLIENEWGGQGTGFLVSRFIPPNRFKFFLCTNKHVINENDLLRKQATKIRMHVNIKEKNKSEARRFVYELVNKDNTKKWKEHPDSLIDVLVIDVTQLYINHPEIIIQAVPESFIADSTIIDKEDISMGEEIFILGYPLGFKQGDENSPITRQGIIATQVGKQYIEEYYDNKNIKRERRLRGFLIDGGAIPGSSGSPVILKPVLGRIVKNQVEMKSATTYLLGILAETRFAPIKYSFGTLSGFAGLGFVFDAITVKETIELFFKN